MATTPDLPRSLTEFEQRFGDADACAEYLAGVRWPAGFVCPGCDGRKAWRLESKPWTYECVGCGRQTSVTAGTIMHHSKLPLTALRRTCRDRNAYYWSLRLPTARRIRRPETPPREPGTGAMLLTIVFFTIVMAGIIAGSAIVLTFGHFE